MFDFIMPTAEGAFPANAQTATAASSALDWQKLVIVPLQDFVVQAIL
ncbi:MAG: hypothetical protein HQL14_08840, partial [Candidatus Omnitrophica bacterium]|nr:hypothetical protein [Candidatus Omnitrophota bacterium]